MFGEGLLQYDLRRKIILWLKYLMTQNISGKFILVITHLINSAKFILVKFYTNSKCIISVSFHKSQKFLISVTKQWKYKVHFHWNWSGRYLLSLQIGAVSTNDKDNTENTKQKMIASNVLALKTKIPRISYQLCGVHISVHHQLFFFLHKYSFGRSLGFTSCCQICSSDFFTNFHFWVYFN